MKRKTGIFFLICLAATGGIYLLLPQILVFAAEAALKNKGLQANKLTIQQVSLDQINIPHARLTTADGMVIDLKQFCVDYSIPQLLNGSAQSVSVQELDLYLSDKKSNLFDTLSKLQYFLQKDFSALIPLTSAQINTLTIHDKEEKLLLQANAGLRQENRVLKAEIKLLQQDGRDKHLYIVQQQPGQWMLAANNADGGKLISAEYQQTQQFPLNMELNGSLEQLRPWLLLVGQQLPGYQAGLQAKLLLKPDLKQKSFTFQLQAKSTDLQASKTRLDAATATVSGQASMKQTGRSQLEARADIAVTGLQHSELTAEQLHIVAGIQLMQSPEILEGSLQAGSTIDASNMVLLTNVIENLSMEWTRAQAFQRDRSSASWQFEPGSARFKQTDASSGTAGIRGGAFDLDYGEWQYPTAGKTPLEINGTAQTLLLNTLQLANNTLIATGDISWPSAQHPATVIADLKLATKQLRRKALSANNVLLRGRTRLQVDKQSVRTHFEQTTRLIANQLTLGSTRFDSPQIKLQTPLKMHWDSLPADLDVAAERLEFSHQGMASKQMSINPGKLLFSIDNWRGVRNPEFSGQLIAESIEAVANEQAYELKKTDASYAAAGPRFTLEGQSLLQLSNSRINFNLLHDAVSGRGSAAYRTDAQAIVPASSALKKNTKNWPSGLQLLKGTASASGRAKWRETLNSATLQLQLNEVAGSYENANFSGLSTAIDLDLLPTINGKSQQLRIESIQIGASGQDPALPEFNDWDDVITPELVEFVLGSSAARPAASQPQTLKDTTASLSINWPTVSMNGNSLLQSSNSKLYFELSHNINSGMGSATYRSDGQKISGMISALKKSANAWPRELNLLSGTTSLSGQASWHDDKLSASAILKLDDVGGNYGEAYFSGLNSDVRLQLIPVLQGKSDSLQIKLIDIGVPISEFSTGFHIDKAASQAKPVVTLYNPRARFLGGSVGGKTIKLDLNQKINHFTLAFYGVDIAELIKLHQFEGLNAIGKVSGTIPIRLAPDGISISGGRASADTPGGSISYLPKDGGKALKNAAAETGVMLDVLQNFQYQQMDATGAYQPGGQLQVRLEIKGKNPDYDKSRPVHLNLNLDQNILSLLRSVRAINGLNERLDKAVQKYYQSQQR